MEMEIKNAVFFKEYPCYHFGLYAHQPIKTFRQFNCVFAQSQCRLQPRPPAAIVDSYCLKETLYLLQWQVLQKSIILLVRQLEAQDWIEIKINLFPDFVTISGGTIFVIGGQQLFVFTPKYFRTDRLTIQNDEIISLNSTTYEIGQNNEHQPEYQPGVYILYKNPEGLFYTGEYSSNRQLLNKPGRISRIANIFQTKQQKYLHLEVIIPNILGLAFSEGSKICVYNLSTMSAVQSLYSEFAFALKKHQRPVVKWKKHKMEGYNDTYLILIGVGSFIFSFYLMIKYKPNITNLLIEEEPLTSFLTASIIDWSASALKPYLTFVIEGKELMDLAISTKGFVYLSKDSQSDLIGLCKYIDMNSLLNEYPIITQQCTIWKLYYEDKQEGFKTDPDRLLSPNRYPHQLVDYLLDSRLDIEQSNEIALNIWRNKYAFYSFVTYEQELFIVRNGSVSVFRNVPEDIFHREYLTHAQLRKIQAQYLKKGNFICPDSKVYSQFQDPDLEVWLPRPLILERTYKIISQQDQESQDYLQIAKKSATFQLVYSEIQGIIGQKHQHIYHSLTIPQLQIQLICSQLKDKISYFSLVLSNNVSYLHEDQRQRQYNKLYEKNSFLAKVMKYFYELYLRQYQHYRVFGKNLIDLFVSEQTQSLSADINASVHIIMQMLLQNLLPKEISNKNSSLIYNQAQDAYQLFSNSFLQFLIARLKRAVEQQNFDEMELLRRECSTIVRVGFFSQRSIFFNEIWRNISLFQVLVLSTQTALTQSIFDQYLLFNLKAREIHIRYTQMKRYMLDETIRSIERQLYLNEAKHNLKIDINYLSFAEWISGDSHLADIYQRINQDIVSRELLPQGILFKQDNIGEIMNVFDRLIVLRRFDATQFKEIKRLIRAAVIPDKQQMLEFHQQVLVIFVRLFNDRVSKDHKLIFYQNLWNSSQQQKEQFLSSRGNLRDILSSVRSAFQQYKRCYELVYGSEDYSSLEGQNRSQEKLMSRMFIDDPVLLLDRFILSQTALQLIQMAMHYEEGRRDIQKLYLNSLKCFSNLFCFWLIQLQGLPNHTVAYYYRYLNRYDYQQSIKGYVRELTMPDDYKHKLTTNYQFVNDEQIQRIISEIPLMTLI